MLRILLCISCCSAPQSNNRSAKHVPRTNSKQISNGASNEISNQDSIKKQSEESEDEKENNQLSTNQTPEFVQDRNARGKGAQGKLTLLLDDKNLSHDAPKDDWRQEAVPVCSQTLAKHQLVDAASHECPRPIEDEQAQGQVNNHSQSLVSSGEIGPFTDSFSTIAAESREETDYRPLLTNQSELDYHEPSHKSNEASLSERKILPSQRCELPGASPKDIPSTTKIGDYARIEYSPVEDLESVTTMSYSRFGSEKDGNRSQAEDTLSGQNLPTFNISTDDHSRRSSQGGIESTSISIASQLSNEQFQQNLSNMLESVNTHFQQVDFIGLPLGPPLDGLQTETTKTSPETPGAALTSASQDSLSDVPYNHVSTIPTKSGTYDMEASTGAALVGDSIETNNVIEELVEFSQTAPLATGEDIHAALSPPRQGNLDESKSAQRVGSPLSITTTASSRMTNPTPTPSEMSAGSGKKKRLNAKALFKKLRPGSKKKNENQFK